MGKKTGISWSDATWNPWQGCHKVSQGCKNCYMYREKERWGQDPNKVIRSKDKTFNAPLTWEDPCQIFTCSWSDWFLEEADSWRNEAWQIIRQTPRHIYMILTKRPERIKDHLPADWYGGWANVMLGISAENQAELEKRLPYLLDVPANGRFISAEPLLGKLDFTQWTDWNDCDWCGGFLHDGGHDCYDPRPFVDWMIAGGESGPEARPMHPNWVRSIRDQCARIEIDFHFKQWGEWLPSPHVVRRDQDTGIYAWPWGEEVCMVRSGKEKAGRELDGKIWDQFPERMRLSGEA